MLAFRYFVLLILIGRGAHPTQTRQSHVICEDFTSFNISHIEFLKTQLVEDPFRVVVSGPVSITSIIYTYISRPICLNRALWVWSKALGPGPSPMFLNCDLFDWQIRPKT